MCGIAGYISDILSLEIGKRMAQAVRHRGPDHQDARFYEDQHCCLAHARLSIIDLSTGANQPMEYEDLAIVFNGEVYNFADIRKELEGLGHRFRLHSDTEVILHAYKQWGTDCVKRFIGMFAFAILDKGRSELVIMRDRAGVKPLYYYQSGTTFLFASELKSMYEHPAFRKEIDKEAVALYFKYAYVPAPKTIFKGAYKLLPGHLLRFNIKNRTFTTEKYWDVLEFYRRKKLSISYEEAMEELESILASAFNYRMVADVPVGVFLSGGYDSVGLTAILQKDRTEKLKTFTIGFPTGDNEMPAAEQIARHLGTDHRGYMCTPEECKQIIPELPFYYDEPFADNSAVPTILVSRMARKEVTVALSADAGDETFAGYNRYAGVAGVASKLRMLGSFKSTALAQLIKAASHLANPYSFLREKIEYLAKVVGTDAAYRAAVLTEGGSFSTLMDSLMERTLALPLPTSLYMLSEQEYHDAVSVAQAIDYISYMADDILVKVDRAAMSCSLESREPLIDHRIIEFAAQLPTEYKYKNGVKKRIYKDIVYKYVPREMMERPKTGFMMPVDGWLRSDLRYLLDNYLNEQQLNTEIFNVKNVMQMKQLYLNDKMKHENKLIWRLLMFQMWQQKNL